MSFYVAKAVSNVFEVKDKAKFKEFCDKWGTEIYDYEGDSVLLHVENSDDGSWPHYRQDDDGNELEFEDFIKELSTHLKGKSVAVLMEVGWEKAWLTGFAMAVNAKGKTRVISILDIFEKAKKLGQVNNPYS